MTFNTIRFADDRLYILDQTLLPNKMVEIELIQLDQAVEAIQALRVRGAPAIGITAAYAFFIEAKRLSKSRSLTDKNVSTVADTLKASRPTAVNLEWAVDKMYGVFRETDGTDQSIFLENLRDCAVRIHKDDRSTCEAIGKHGSALIRDGSTVLTHCNAGILATGGIGTALSIVYTAKSQGKAIHVYVDETRPLGQGARLTYWELQKNEVPATLITDNMAGSLMKGGKIDTIIVGADRIAANGDFANKIGTYPLAVLAAFHKIPFYCAAPRSTFDFNLETGANINIENRAKHEITDMWNILDPDAYTVYNPAFDVTPHHLLSGIITELGIIKKPFKQNIKQLLPN
jgi:methylthioribose-1-phosphate isomerase